MRTSATMAIMAVVLAGCATSPTTRALVLDAAPVFAPCPATVPQRPIMPLENLPHNATLDAFVAASIAEVHRRESYELQLRDALVQCTTDP